MERKGPGRRGRWGWGMPLAVGLTVLAIGLSIARPVPVGVFHDDGVYVLLGKALAEGDGLRYTGVPGEPPAAKFPPAYPLFLGFLWKLFPGFPENVRAFELANVGMVAAAAALSARFSIRHLGLPAALGAAAALLAVTSVEVWRFAAVPLSESLFLLLWLAAAILATRVERERDASPALWAALVVVGGLLMYTRTVGAVLPVALALSLASLRRWRAVGGVVACGPLLVAPWALWTRRVSASLPEPLRDLLGPYSSWLTAQVVADPGYALSETLAGTGVWIDHYAAAVVAGPRGPMLALALAALPASALGIRALWERSRTTLFLLIGYGVVTWLWPFKDVRLVLPALPLLAVALTLGIRHGFASGRPVLRVAAAAGGAYAAALLVTSAVSLAADAHLQGVGARTRLLSEAVRAVETTTCPSAVVGAPDLWAGLHLYTGRRAAPSARFLPLARQGPVWGSASEQHDAWAATRLTHLLVEHGGIVHGEALRERRRLEGFGSVRTVATFDGGASLVALTRPGSCELR